MSGLGSTHVIVDSMPASGGGLTDTELRASAVPVTIPTPVPVTDNAGSLTVDNANLDVALSTRLKPADTLTAVTTVGTITNVVHVDDNAGSLTVDGTFWQATQPVSIASMPSTPVTGTFWQATQPVSGTVAISGNPADNIAQIVGTTATVNEGAAAAGSLRVVLATTATVANNPIGSISLGNSLGKAWAGVTGNLVTTAVTADQVIATYTVTAGKTFYLQGVLITARLTTFATTATFFGACSLETPSGTKKITLDAAGAGIVAPPIWAGWDGEPMPIAAGAVIRVVCTPSAVTSFTWKAAIYGYEK